MRLGELLRSAGIEARTGDAEISGVTYDSRQAGPGMLFVAIDGLRTDGHGFARSAVEAGAAAVVAEHAPEPPLPGGTPLVLVPDCRVALAQVAAAMAGHPSRSMLATGVTGTDGKTTTATMIWAAHQAAGSRTGCLTTVDIRTGTDIEKNSTRQTTLEAVELQQHLARMHDAGCTAVVVETSSHALALHRADSVDYRCAVFTRITSEHLELHGTREAYRAAKGRLIDLAARRSDGVAILDADDDFGYPYLSRIPIGQRLGYSAAGAPADLRARDVRAGEHGSVFVAVTPWGEAELRLRIPGRFNVANALAALGAACACGVGLETAAQGISALERVNGRMEAVPTGLPFRVVIDYAHTAEALERTLSELRALTDGRLWVVFGSAGERDHEKRPAMGGVAARLADVAVLTDEDPREEDRMAILEEIAAGARAAGAIVGESVLIIPDREAAIEHAIANAQDGDTILLAGKGHESSLIAAGGPRPYSERAVAEAALRRRSA